MTVFTITFNEEFMLPHFIKHYRKMFPGCDIVVYDNQSTDNTVAIAKKAGCEVITYDTGGKLNDLKYLEIKNNCWKAVTGWVIIADCDEHCDFNEQNLMEELANGATIIDFAGYNMVNMKDTMDYDSIKTGVRSTSYDKKYCFRAGSITEIYYGPGCHDARPIGKVNYSVTKYNCRHYKYVNPDYMIARHAMFAERLSYINQQKGYGGHYLYSEQQIRDEWKVVRSQAKPIV